MADFSVQIQGMEELQRANQRLIQAIRPGNGLGAAVKTAGQEIARYMISITHVDTGALRASERMEYAGGVEATIYIDDATRNPRTGYLPAIYGAYENARGDSHAFAERTVVERGDAAVEMGLEVMLRMMP